jgi:phage repressor protein C with HTH and peptisase S24 domain
MIKRLRECPEGILVTSDNYLLFQSFIIKESQIVGRVKWVFNDYDQKPSK